MSVSIAVIMTCHNRKITTLHCLDALSKACNSRSFSLHFYILDDASDDGTAEAISSLYPEACVIKGDGRQYWTRGMRIAFGKAMSDSHKFYLWLNDDVILFEHAIETLLKCYEDVQKESRKETIVVGSLVDPLTKTVTYGGHNRQGSRWLRRNQRIYSETQHLPCESFSGNCVLIPHEAAVISGNLDGVYHHAFGDHDYGYRCSALHIRIIACAGAVGACREVDGTLRLSDDNKRDHLAALSLLQRLKIVVSPKHYPIRSWFVFCRRHLGPLWLFRFALPYLIALNPRIF